MIELAIGARDTSRLGCQLRVQEALHGARVVLPDDVLVSRTGLRKPTRKLTTGVGQIPATVVSPNCAATVSMVQNLVASL